ncbi:tetratricopeptide repeat protein [Rhizobium sp. CG4]|jgi:tetratricopeptide (TPR) repeat protein|uniref:tetratricopeptide repeat protein n=1 Tax=Rhizobium sp. CG4 TaxID=2726075 RepID=UPI002034623D|nr:tetratricopeptide repeat protein [Rhizobium sp. CG4]MCM2456359.1 tetratricopeptide repeat protein [Rhizobium sp. CG4]
MRRKPAFRFLCGVAFVASLTLGAVPGTASAETKPAEKAETFDPASVNSFSGAFLAARTADVDQDYDTAITLYTKALDFDPANSEIRQRLMIAQLLNGNFDAGAKIAESLKNDSSVERVTTIVRALDAMRKKEFTSAEKLLKYTGPNDLDKMVNTLLIAWANAGAGKSKEALAMIDGMKGPGWYAIFKNYHAGAMALVAGNVEVARSRLNAAITDREGGATASDTYMRAVMALARLEAKAGNKQKALDAISVGDDFANNYAPLKALRESIEKGEKPEQQVTTATEGASAVLFSIAGALNREGAEEIVTLYLQIAHELDSKSADTLILLGGLAENLKQPERAIEFYSKVPATSPMHRISELQLGLTLAQTGKVDEAREHLKSLLASDPKDIRSYLAYGSVLSDAKDYKAMAENYDKAVEILGPVAKRGDWAVYFQRGIAYERLKEWDQAEPNFKKALELNPEQPQVLNYLGYSWVDKNLNLDDAMDMIRRAVELRPNDGYIVDSLGWAHYRLGQFDEAVVELERAIELRAGDPTINDHLGDVYWRVGRKVEAVYQWNRALIGDSDDVDKAKVKEKIANGLPPLEKDAENTAKKDVKPEEPVAPVPDKKS